MHRPGGATVHVGGFGRAVLGGGATSTAALWSALDTLVFLYQHTCTVVLTRCGLWVLQAVTSASCSSETSLEDAGGRMQRLSMESGDRDSYQAGSLAVGSSGRGTGQNSQGPDVRMVPAGSAPAVLLLLLAAWIAVLRSRVHLSFSSRVL